ncbi:MAG: TonB-dependent receptor [Sphingobacteriales bacterium]|nr:TonB-dependent receptor [Sphingobacteriales bacterium]OJY92626.1 MAG: SusC/RagA family TonB-linked outer membrane protein [Sphingobacteriales bacterium 44-15]
MKLTALLLFVACLHVSARTYSQKVSLSGKNLSLEQIFELVKTQTGYDAIYNPDLLKKAKRVSIHVQDADLTEALQYCFRDQPLGFLIRYNTIIVTTKPKEKEAFTISAEGQDQAIPPVEINGKVLSETGDPLSGVSIAIKGTAKGTVTGNDGSFTIEASEGDVLVVSFVGYIPQEIKVAQNKTLSIKLKQAANEMDQVVVVGYGTQKKRDLTGSLSQVKGDEINAFPTTNVFQALSGRSSGVQVMQSTGSPGASVSIRIRGSNSIRGSNEPLYVVDGFPINNPTILNNADIESIEILKDASSTAIYGSRGANGVVLITTKKGKAGKNIIDFESSYSTQSLIRKLDLMNAKEYATLYNIKAVNDGVAPYFTQNEIDNFGNGFDWQDFIYQPAPFVTTSLNINGGNNKTKFSISGSVINQDGIIKGSNYDRYSFRSSIDHQFNKKFSAELSTIFTRINTETKNSGGGARGNTLISSQYAPPTLTPYNDDGSYRVLAPAYPFLAPDLINPLNFINEQSNAVKANINLINGSLIYKPIEELTLKISGGVENRDDRTDSYTTRNFLNSNGSASVSTGQYTSLLNENTLTYTKTFNEKHSLSALAGVTYQDFISTSLAGSGTGFLSDAFETYDLNAAITPGIPGSGYSKSVLLSYLGRINYSFKNKYLATVSYRADGSSKFSKGNKWGYFPSAALAWRISDENFLKNNNLISNMKLRASWGMTGSQAIGPYVTLNQLSSGITVFNDALYNAFAPGTQLPGDLKWETTEQMNFGLDLGIIDNRINITADYYIKNTRDLLNTVSLPSSLGFTQTIQNIGKVQNKGFEFNVDARILQSNFKWDVNANISFNRNKVVKLYNGEDILTGSGVLALQGTTSILREGRPIGQFFGYLEDGYDDNGKIKYKDLQPDNKLTGDDRTYIGDPNPDFIYGLSSGLSYKNFTLDIFLQGSYGNDLFNLSSVAYAYDFVSGLNMIKDVLTNSWTPEHTNAKYPVTSRNTSVNVSNRFIEDGSYLRLKNIQLAYDLPLKHWSVNKVIESLQLYASGQNLLTFTKYSGWDPEVNSSGFGIDNNSYPMSKTVTFGIRARF